MKQYEELDWCYFLVLRVQSYAVILDKTKMEIGVTNLVRDRMRSEMRCLDDSEKHVSIMIDEVANILI